MPSVHLFGGPAAIDGLLAVLVPWWEYDGEIILNFHRCGFLSADAVAVLASFKLHRDTAQRTTSTEWSTVGKSLVRQLGKWKASSVFGGNNLPWIDTCVPLMQFSQINIKESSKYVDDFILSRAEMPKMCDLLSKITRNAISEVLSNVFDHSDSPIGAVTIGQVYPKKRMFQICVCDVGVGIVKKVQSWGFRSTCPIEAIHWSLVFGHTTSRGGTSRGFGLPTLRQFLKANDGELRIQANCGAFCEKAGIAEGRVMPVGFPGTLVDLRFNIRDDAGYTVV